MVKKPMTNIHTSVKYQRVRKRLTLPIDLYKAGGSVARAQATSSFFLALNICCVDAHSSFPFICLTAATENPALFVCYSYFFADFHAKTLPCFMQKRCPILACRTPFGSTYVFSFLLSIPNQNGLHLILFNGHLKSVMYIVRNGMKRAKIGEISFSHSLLFSCWKRTELLFIVT
jgi:hypothetical protein